MNAKHTPGPWRLDGATVKGCRGDMYPILLDAEGSGLADADLRLIAAAPDLLEALRTAADRLGVLVECDNEDHGGASADDAAAYAEALAAIRKATGETP